MFMRPRDMLKYGQLYLDGGTWQGRRVLSADWVNESWQVYGRLAPLDRNGHEYGYLWWHHQYVVDGTTIRTHEARGNGGQYIFVVPSLDMVAVITSGNFRNGRVRQPEEILRRWLLPAAFRGVISPRDESPSSSADDAEVIELDANPLEVPPEALFDLEVLETIKEGRTVCRRGE